MDNVAHTLIGVGLARAGLAHLRFQPIVFRRRNPFVVVFSGR